jgi:HSP20 family molecular chaperone IbpA
MSEMVPIHKTSSIFDELKNTQDRIVQRAYEIFERNGRVHGHDLDHWLAAEREFVWNPRVELREKDHEFQLQVAVPGVDPKDIDIEVTPEDVLLKAELSHEHKEEKGTVHICEFECGRMFRSIHLPKKIDPERVNAEFRNGMLRITAEIAAEAPVRKIRPEAA